MIASITSQQSGLPALLAWLAVQEPKSMEAPERTLEMARKGRRMVRRGGRKTFPKRRRRSY